MQDKPRGLTIDLAFCKESDWPIESASFNDPARKRRTAYGPQSTRLCRNWDGSSDGGDLAGFAAAGLDPVQTLRFSGK